MPGRTAWQQKSSCRPHGPGRGNAIKPIDLVDRSQRPAVTERDRTAIELYMLAAGGTRSDTDVMRRLRIASIGVLFVIAVGGAPMSAAREAQRTCVPTAQKRCQLDVLRPDGIGGLRFGATPKAARRVIDALLHQPGGATQRSGSCAVDRQITWQDQWTADAQPSLTLYFGRAGLIGYQVGAQQEPRWPHGGWMPATVRGLQVGDPLTKGRALYGSSITLSAEQGGVWKIQSGGRLDGYAWSARSGHLDVGWSSLVASIDAGDVGCPATGP